VNAFLFRRDTLTGINMMDENDLFHHFQPIYHLGKGEIIGYESLLRVNGKFTPEKIFNEANKKGKLYELDSWSIHKAIETYRKAGFTKNEGSLFINIFPSTMLNKDFLPFISNIMKKKLLENQEIILEINEKEPINDYRDIKQVLNYLKEFGIKYAIDDFGIGQGGFERIIELQPAYLKLDKYFSKDLLHSLQKQEIIKDMVIYCEKFGIELIVEGLDNEQDIFITKKLGVCLGQGFKLGRPNDITSFQR
jgi:EAL domain-containing protein (putative c-di-GMP-specific phosphodiesterase class I)